MRRLFLATGIGVSSLTATAQLPPEEWFSPCDDPLATCISPHIEQLAGYFPYDGFPNDDRRLSTEPDCGPIAFAPLNQPALVAGQSHAKRLVAYHEPPLMPIADDAHEILHRWSIASQHYLPATEAERLRLQHASPERTGQELSLTCELLGPIDHADFMQRYDWSVVDDADDVTLTAVPKDGLERLFYDRFTVTLAAGTWRPASVEFVSPDRDRSTVVALHPWVDEPAVNSKPAGNLQVVAFRPSDESAIRTADISQAVPHDNSHRESRSDREIDMPIALPPAPTPCETAPSVPVEAVKP